MWWCGDAGTITHPVGQKLANQYGLHDVHGNVFEWVSDWYGSSYYVSSPLEDPGGPTSGTDRVVRGGSFYRSARFSRSAARGYALPDYRGGDVGFRLAMSQ